MLSSIGLGTGMHSVRAVRVEHIRLTPALKALGSNCFKVNPFQATGFKMSFIHSFINPRRPYDSGQG